MFHSAAGVLLPSPQAAAEHDDTREAVGDLRAQPQRQRQIGQRPRRRHHEILLAHCEVDDRLRRIARGLDGDGGQIGARPVEAVDAVEPSGDQSLAHQRPRRAGEDRRFECVRRRQRDRGVAGGALRRQMARPRRHRDKVDLGRSQRRQYGEGVVVAGVAIMQQPHSALSLTGADRPRRMARQRATVSASSAAT